MGLPDLFEKVLRRDAIGECNEQFSPHDNLLLTYKLNGRQLHLPPPKDQHFVAGRVRFQYSGAWFTLVLSKTSIAK